MGILYILCKEMVLQYAFLTSDTISRHVTSRTLRMNSMRGRRSHIIIGYENKCRVFVFSQTQFVWRRSPVIRTNFLRALALSSYYRRFVIDADVRWGGGTGSG